MIGKNEIADYLSEKNFDIRISHNSRWIDQKCTPDVIQVVAEGILKYIENESTEFFQLKISGIQNFLRWR